MGRIGCPEKSVRNYHYSLRNNPEEGSCILLVLMAETWNNCPTCFPQLYFLNVCPERDSQ
jgi:hypothetical protein